MKNQELQFDREKHLLYSKAVGKIIRRQLELYDPQQADQLWNKFQQQYVKFLDSVEYMGGAKNRQAGGVYDSVALFAYYEILPEKITVEEFAKVCDEYFKTPSFLGKLVSLNWKPILRVGNFCAAKVAENNRRHQKEWPGQYQMTVLPYDPEQGIRFRFDYCPIAEFAKAHGYEFLMPAMCNPDYYMMDTIHGHLIRTTTCANGSCCDYQIVGDKSDRAKAHPRMKNEEGYLFNRLD